MVGGGIINRFEGQEGGGPIPYEPPGQGCCVMRYSIHTSLTACYRKARTVSLSAGPIQTVSARGGVSQFRKNLLLHEHGRSDRPHSVTFQKTDVLRTYQVLKLRSASDAHPSATSRRSVRRVRNQGSTFVSPAAPSCAASSQNYGTPMLCCSAPWQHPVIFRPMALTTLPVPVTLVLPG